MVKIRRQRQNLQLQQEQPNNIKIIASSSSSSSEAAKQERPLHYSTSFCYDASNNDNNNNNKSKKKKNLNVMIFIIRFVLIMSIAATTAFTMMIAIGTGTIQQQLEASAAAEQQENDNNSKNDITTGNSNINSNVLRRKNTNKATIIDHLLERILLPSKDNASFFFFPDVLMDYMDGKYRSDIVEIRDYCDVNNNIIKNNTGNFYHNFTNWATPILNRTLQELMKQEWGVLVNHATTTTGTAAVAAAAAAAVTAAATPTGDLKRQLEMILVDIRNEFSLELFEMYLTSSNGGYDNILCDYSVYQPTISGNGDARRWTLLQQAREKRFHNYIEPVNDDDVGGRLIQQQQQQQQAQAQAQQPRTPPRIVFVIVAFRDVRQLDRLVKAIHMPQHYIIVHLERRTPSKLRHEIETRIIARYSGNIIIVQFGSVIYRTDLISHINYRIMSWLVHDVKLQYDYHVTLGGATYPLLSPQELSLRLSIVNTAPPPDVYLGELTHKGQRVVVSSSSNNNNRQHPVQNHKRLVYTRSSHLELKLHKRLPRSLFQDRHVLPGDILRGLQLKSVSGNQGIYSYRVVEKLVSSTHVKQLFLEAKYGCCCCLEEHTWIAALTCIGYGGDALKHTSMFELWGGKPYNGNGNNYNNCESSMSNTFLSTNSSLCYRNEHVVLHNNKDSSTRSSNAYFGGNETWGQLVEAKKRGFVFARKFHSDYPQSMAILQDIQQYLWQHQPQPQPQQKQQQQHISGDNDTSYTL